MRLDSWQYPEAIYNFLNSYAELPHACWRNEIVRVEFKNSAPWSALDALPQLECALCFIVAEKDEMENAAKGAQYDAFRRATSATAHSRIVEVPCHVDMGFGHAGMMDSCGLIGHKETWQGMIDAIEPFLLGAFPITPAFLPAAVTSFMPRQCCQK